MPSSDPRKPALSSNKVNYLIWRYLQESGFSQAAVELQRAWNPDPHNNLPFAPRVQNEWLKGILLLGLEYDEAHERVSKGKIAKRFDLGAEDGPQYARRSGGFEEGDLYDAAFLPYGTDLHPSVAPPKNGQLLPVPDTRAGVTPAQSTTGKSKSKSRGRKGTATKEQRPTDLMDIDTNGALQDLSSAVGDGNASEIASPAIEEALPEPQSTADVGDEKDTQINTVEHPEAATFKLSPSIRPATAVVTSIEHVAFAPNEPQALLLAGQNLARICIVPAGLSDRSADYDLLASSVDVDLQDANLTLATCNVLAFAWTPGSGTAAMAVWKTFTSDGASIARGSVVQLLPGSTENTLATKPLPGADNVRDVVALEWNADMGCLLSLSITGRSSWLRAWRHSPGKPQEFYALPSRRETGKRLFRAKWISRNRFIACGEDVVAVYDLDESLEEIQKRHEWSGNGREWHRILHDTLTHWVVLLSNDTNELGRLAADDLHRFTAPATCELPAIATDFALQPITDLAGLGQSDRRLLAVACETGELVIMDMRTWAPVTTLALGMQKCAGACAWSPDGSRLAVAGDGRVVVWRIGDVLPPHNSSPANALPRAVWVADDENFGRPPKRHVNGVAAVSGDRLTNGVQRSLATMNIDGVEEPQINGNGHTHSDETESQASSDAAETPAQALNWHLDGRTLIYTIGDQVAVITVDLREVHKGP